MIEENILQLYELKNPLKKDEYIIFANLEGIDIDSVKKLKIVGGEKTDSSYDYRSKIVDKLQTLKGKYLGRGFLKACISSSIGYLTYPIISSTLFYTPLKLGVDPFLNSYLTSGPILDLLFYSSISGQSLLQYLSRSPPLVYEMMTYFSFLLPIALFGGYSLYSIFKGLKNSKKIDKIVKLFKKESEYVRSKDLNKINRMIEKDENLNKIIHEAQNMNLNDVVKFLEFLRSESEKNGKKDIPLSFILESGKYGEYKI
jgi:hypothetical protein